jgi:cell division protein FtsW
MQPSIYRLRLQDILLLCVLGLLFLGVVMVQSASMNITGQVDWHWTGRASRHVAFALLALLTFLVVGHMDYAWFVRRDLLRSPATWLLIIAIITCILVLVPGVGRVVNGARRWLWVFQPSELGKWGLVLFMAWWLARRPVNLHRFFGFVLTLLPAGIICFLIVIQDLGTAALIGVCAMAMCLAGGVKLWHLGIMFPPAAALGGLFVWLEPYRMQRVLAFLDPFASPRAEGYHMVQSLLAFASGGIFGRGLGRGVQKLGYLPEDTTDFIFAVICEELGIFGALMVVALYLGILYVVWQVIRQKKDALGQLLAFGIGTMVGLQALINIAVATVSVPPKGLSLPLVSAGGTGLVITCGALGLLYSACRTLRQDCVLDPANPDEPEPAVSAATKPIPPAPDENAAPPQAIPVT